MAGSISIKACRYLKQIQIPLRYSFLKTIPCSRKLSNSSLLYQRYFTKDHEWIDVEGNVGKVGITDYAQEKLGELVYVELPESGTQVKAQDSVGTVESVKAASDIFSPVSGTVKELNEELVNTPDLVNKSPEEKGWIYTIELSNKNELNELLSKDGYSEFLKGEDS
ncbi:glycine cleavage system H protein isoform X2 [Hydra vulgaris]|uniref:Glycine cleavage system H protein n=1 Tax=Hydra vulgaris TaxID=6087 RepID=A0ABM4DP21_HYDVU